MNISTELRLAERSRQAMERRLKTINRALPDLRELCDGDDCSILYQPGDGWVIVFAGRRNACITPEELDHFVTQSPESALQFLEHLQRKDT